ncbi:MAG: arsenate reductase (glutaredoxin) [Deltaproteobacteria bacterium]|nr:arsenate reductase (glutaredoxin) [Deltaproteobacteria bacterium]
MATVTLWHDPDCSKSRRALAHLEELGIDVTVRAYRKEPPTRDELLAVLAALGLPASGLARRNEALFDELGLGSASDATILDAMLAYPSLIERPIAVRFEHGKLRAALGRPPVRVLEVVAPSMEFAPHVADAIARLNGERR